MMSSQPSSVRSTALDNISQTGSEKRKDTPNRQTPVRQINEGIFSQKSAACAKEVTNPEDADERSNHGLTRFKIVTKLSVSK